MVIYECHTASLIKEKMSKGTKSLFLKALALDVCKLTIKLFLFLMLWLVEVNGNVLGN